MRRGEGLIASINKWTEEIRRTHGMISLDKGIAILDLSRKVLRGDLTDPKEVAKALLGFALDIADVEVLKMWLSEEAKKRIDEAVDTLEAIKVEGG